MSSEQSSDLLACDFVSLSNSLVAIVNFLGIFNEVNPAFISALGYSPEEILGASLFDFCHPDDLDRIVAEFGCIDLVATTAHVEYRFLCKDGTWKLLGWDVQLIPEKEIYFFIGRDISIDERTKTSLQEAKNTLDSVIESIPAMIFMKSAEDLRFTRLNRGGEMLLGTSREELIGKSDYDFFTKEQADFFVANDRAVLNSNKVLNIPEEPIQNSNGETIYLSTSKVGLRDINGEPTHLLGISIDITERRNAELRLREVNTALSAAQSEAETANRAKSEFLAKMSHEIRTPMNGVLGMADVLRETSLNQNQVEMVELIQTSAFSLLHIIDDILDFSKIEAGQLECEMQSFSPIECIEGVCAMLKNLALKKNVLLTVFADPELPAQVQGDSRRLQQVFINLINNAIKFSSDGTHSGRVSVHAATHTQSDTEAVIDFTVEDNGIGMDQPTRARLFTPFMQKDSSTSRIYGGTGLGLVITQNLVELMGGNITVESTLHQGSVFKVRIPFALQPESSLEQQHPAGVEDNAINRPVLLRDVNSTASQLEDSPDTEIGDNQLIVLVADDNEINQNVLLRQLQILGYQGQVANNGREALEYWRNGNYALLLTDLHMPHMDGYELCAAIRAEEDPSERLPIILITANVLATKDPLYTSSDLDGHLTKPARLGEFREILEKWLMQ